VPDKWAGVGLAFSAMAFRRHDPAALHAIQVNREIILKNKEFFARNSEFSQ
jgi:hypothetical protein